MKTDDPRWDLIQRALAGLATNAELAQLEESLRADEQFRAAYVRSVNVEVALGTAALPERGIATADSPLVSSLPSRLHSRSLWAAAAGILFGILGTSVVFAYVAPLAAKTIFLLQDSFETGLSPSVTGVSHETGRWSGDYTEVVSAQQGVQPASGHKMLRFLRADYDGKPNAEGYVTDLYRLIDLRPYQREFADGGSVVEFSAAYNAASFPEHEAYSCLMSLHTLDAETVERGNLNDRQLLNSDALAMTSSSRLMLDRDPTTWQRQTAELRLPANADFLLVKVGVSHAKKTQQSVTFNGHFLDEVRLVMTRRPPLP